MINLLIGPPASGKTTLLRAMAKAAGRKILNAESATDKIWQICFQGMNMMTDPVMFIEDGTNIPDIRIKQFTENILKGRECGEEPEIWIATQEDLFPVTHWHSDEVRKYYLKPFNPFNP